MNIQNYLLCILYIVLITVHSCSLCHKDYHRGLISIFSFALFAETLSTILLTIHQVVLNYGHHIADLTSLDLSPVFNIHYFAQLIHITSLNFFILFLLIIAKGWPITRHEIPSKYAFLVFWILCLVADLTTFYWTTITLLAKNLTNTYYSDYTSSITAKILPTSPPSSLLPSSFSSTSASPLSSTTPSSTSTISLGTTIASLIQHTTGTNSTSTSIPKPPESIIDDLSKDDEEQFNSTPRRLSLLLRIIIMIYFLLELRTTMILEQEKKKLQFYLHFGALSMVWFVHSLIVYVISLRVEIVWQSKLTSGFSSAANFLAFAITTRILWPRSSRSYLFRKRKRYETHAVSDGQIYELTEIRACDDEEEFRS